MSGFIDEYMPSAVPGYPCITIPRWNTAISVNSGGHEKRTRLWQHPLHTLTLPDAPGREWAVVNGLKKHWLVTAGPHKSFPFRDPTDFASVDLTTPNVEPTIAMTDQLIGAGDGTTREFQLIKTYTVGAETYVRDIELPVLASLAVAVDGVLVNPADYTVSRPGGLITFNVAPGAALNITAGYYFDVMVRFVDDDMLETIMRSFQVGGFSNIELVEVRNC